MGGAAGLGGISQHERGTRSEKRRESVRVGRGCGDATLEKREPGQAIDERTLREAPYCAGIATARLVRIDSFAASMISLTPTLIAAETRLSMGLLLRMQYRK